MNRVREFTPRIPAAAIDGMAPSGVATWESVTGKPTTFPPATHSHDYAASDHTHTELATLAAGLDGKAPTSHSHAISSVSGLQTALDGKAATGHTHVAANITDLTAAVTAIVGGLGLGGSGLTQSQVLARGLGA